MHPSAQDRDAQLLTHDAFRIGELQLKNAVAALLSQWPL
jgi:hypothetical protein